MCKMKILIFVLFLFPSLLLNAQQGNKEKKEVSILFDINSEKEFLYEGESFKFFQKTEWEEGVEYGIGDESFFVEKGSYRVELSSIKDVKLSDFKDIKKDIETDTIWGFKSDIYEKVYLYEKICDDKYIKHEAVLLYFEI